MTDKSNVPAAPKSALEIATALAREGTLQDALKKTGQIDLQKHLPLSMQLEDMARKNTTASSLLDTLKRNQSAGNSFTEALKHSNLADQLRKIGMGQSSSFHAPESRHGVSRTSGSLIQSAKDIGAAIRAERKAKGLTQQQFADLAGVGRRFLSELEAGKPTCEIGRVLKVAAAAGLHLMIAPAGRPDE
jgi:y4mF family transcriptional regulator